MYRIEIIFRFNQDNTLPDCIKDVHRVANTDYFEILAGTFSDNDFPEVHEFLCDTEKERGFVSSYFETLSPRKIQP